KHPRRRFTATRRKRDRGHHRFVPLRPTARPRRHGGARMTIPRYVVGTAAEATQILRRLQRSGWHPRPGFTVPSPATTAGARIVLYGRIPTQSAASAAASAA